MLKGFFNNYRKMSRTSSGGLVEALATPLKLLQKDSSTGEYIVKMSPEDFARINNSGQDQGSRYVIKT